MNHPHSHKIAIIGPTDTVSGFRALGVETFDAHTAEDLMTQLEHIKSLTVDETIPVVYAVVCIIDDLMSGVDEVAYARAVDGPLPAVVILPGAHGTRGHAEQRLRRLSERAIGSAII